jgi:hypothetical protein
MSYNDNKLSGDDGEEDDGKGGKSGEIEFRFHDALLGPSRDDLLPPSEIKRLFTVHQELHQDRVTKQKQLREQRLAQKEGRYIPPPSASQQLKQGLGGAGGGSSPYKKHPISDKFSGIIDTKVVGIPSLTDANTNDQLREALENKLQNKYQLGNQKRFDPRPRPGG